MTTIEVESRPNTVPANPSRNTYTFGESELTGDPSARVVSAVSNLENGKAPFFENELFAQLFAFIHTTACASYLGPDEAGADRQELDCFRRIWWDCSPVDDVFQYISTSQQIHPAAACAHNRARAAIR